MKTKKVGKIVSLLVAIVLVATIMIPAASVLADNGSNAVSSGVNWTGADILTVSSTTKDGGASAYEQLRDYLKNAQPGQELKIRLDADISLPTFGVYKNTNGDTSSSASAGYYYSYATYGVFKDAYKKKEGKKWWDATDNPKFGINEILGKSGSTYGASYDVLNKNPSISTNPYKDVFKVAEPGDTTTRAFLNYDLQGKENFSPAERERFERLDTAQKKLMTGARGNEALGASAGNDTATYTEYDEAVLCVKEGVTVCLNLNGHKVSGLNSLGSPYTGAPNYQTSIFVVKGSLTVVDERVVNAGTEAIITGGSGSIFGKPQYSENGENNYDLVDSGIYQGVAYYGVGLGGNAPNEWGDAYIIRRGKEAPDRESWPDLSTQSWNHKVGNYRIYTNYFSRFYANVKETHGGGVYVAPGASFTLLSGKISGNSAWRLNDTDNKFIFNVNSSAVACGGGVYVDENATFTMKGGEISNNAVRVYNKKKDNSDATAYGGGVYLASGAVMNMTGGKIVENASYAETFSPNAGSPKSARSYGAGIYVHENAICNIIGEDAESGATTLEMVKSFPSVSNNSCGALGRKTTKSEQDVTVEGGGIYNSGTLNLRNALVSANDFAEGDIDVPNADQKCTLNNAIHVKRDEATGLALYNYVDALGNKTEITRLDNRFNENLELVTEAIEHEKYGIYGTMHGNEESAIFSNGAGICLNEKATIVIGERVWVIDNYDLVTTGHKAFKSVRDYTRTWQQTKNITDDRVVETIKDGTGVSRGANYTDPAGGYVYNEYVKPGDPRNQNVDGSKYTPHRMDGYAFSDTTDDIYLPEGKVIYKGGSLYETKIGVNYWNMVNADGTATAAERGKGQAGSQAGNRVLLVDGNVLGKKLDRNIWVGDSTTPVQSDIQFFYLNDNNKNWERYKNYKKAANDLWYDYDKNAYNYQLPESDKGRIGGADRDLCDLDAINSKDWEARYRVRAISTSNSAINRDASPYEGYINYDVEYPAGRWAAGQKAWPGANAYDIHKNGGYWNYYNKPTYRISDPEWTPDNDKVFRPLNGAFSNAVVNFPQRAYPVTAEMKNSLPSSYLKAKYMDYKVIYDDNQFGTSTEPVIRLGTYSDAASNDTIRKMFVTVNFDEADIHFYGQSNNSIVYNSGSAATNAKTDTFVNNNLPFANVNAEALFYGANKVQGTIDIAKVVPDYSAYGKSEVLAQLASADGRKALTSISKKDGHEAIDLYFKGWKYYTSYGDGPKVETLSNAIAPENIAGTTLTHRGYFHVDLANIFNPNINSQPCPSLTAIWYTKEELDEARLNISNVKYQIVKRDDGTDLLRAVAIAGSKYEKFAAVGFVISTSNATPTIEGGYDYVTNDTTYERLGVKVNGEQKCYDVDQILGGKYYDEDNGGYHSRIPVEKYNWTFADGTVGGNSTFAANVSTGNYKKGYKDAGLFYTNIIITDANRDTVYFVTPYAKLDDGTYYYGESRAICYADYIN